MNPPDFTLALAPDSKLVFTTADGKTTHGALPVRLFPLTDPAHWVSIVAPGGRELACVENPESLPEASRQVLEAALAYREFVPVVRAIHAIRRAAHGFDWDVTTDLGRVRFVVENDESIQLLAGGGVVIMDSRNTRYLIPDPSRLDPKSRQKLERYY